MIAANIMSTDTALPERATLLDASSIVSAGGAAAVVGADGKVLGLVTPGLLLEHASRDNADLAGNFVSEAMEGNFATITPEADFKAVSLVLEGAGGRSAVVVVDDGSRFLGLITPKDMHRRVWEYTEKKKAGKG